MPRPHKNRIVQHPPLFDTFKPAGIKSNYLDETFLSIDEYEAIRLADYEGLDQTEAAEKMEISRPTFTRLVEKARKKVAEFLVKGQHLTIEGGTIHFNGNIFKCKDCHHFFEVKLNESVKNCTECNSENIENLANNFGHGKCCKKNKKDQTS